MLGECSPFRRVLFALSTLCALSAAPSPAEGVRARGAVVVSRAPKIRASNILDDLLKMKERRQRIRPRALAAYGNALLREKGFDYSFNACDILKANGMDGGDGPRATGRLLTFPYKLARADGRGMTFDILSRDDEGGGMCGECFFEIPALRVTKAEMVVRAEGGTYRLRRPEAFLLDEAALVDRTLRRVLRTWQMPFQAVPSGVSADGSKLYVEFYEGLGPRELLLELSDDGTLKFRARDEAGLRGRGEDLENFPQDPHNAYLSYRRFRAGGRSYVVRFSSPCT